MRARTRSPKTLTALALAAALTGLGIAPRAVASPTAPTPAEVCGMLGDADVKALLGKPAKGEPKDGNTGSNCMWLGSSGMLSVSIETDELLKKQTQQTTAERFDMMKNEVAAKRAQAVAGVGDEAVWQSNILWVRKGKKVAVISINRKGKFPADDLPGAKAAAAKVVAKLQIGNGQPTTVAPHLGRAEGRLHFAGDHTSHRPGFMHGALASARRVVDEIGQL